MSDVSTLLLDLKCLEFGLPPMSGKTKDVVAMILNTPPNERRRINRKVRKLCKTAINLEMQALANNHSGIWKPRRLQERKTQLLSTCGFKVKKTAFCAAVLSRRINFIRRYMLDMVKSEHT